jgi:hypothetical protein
VTRHPAPGPAESAESVAVPDRRAEWDNFARAFAAAYRGIESDPWFGRLDAHTRTYAREAIALTLMGETTSSGLTPARSFALRHADAMLAASVEQRIVNAANYVRGHHAN